jgi:hypothetical protein
MNNRIFLPLLGLFLLCVTPRESSGMECRTAEPSNEEMVATEIALADAFRQRAAEAGAEWVDTGSLIQQAEQAVEMKDWQLAMELACRAKQQGELAVEQAARESVAWRERVVQ